MTFMAFRLFQLVISCKLQPVIEKNGTNGVPGKVPPGRGTNRPKTGRLGKNGTSGNPTFILLKNYITMSLL